MFESLVKRKMSAKFVCSICTLFLSVCCSITASRAPIINKMNGKIGLYRIESSNILRLRGGGLLNWVDPRTPVSWPTYPKDVVPADGSVGGHFTLEEICGSGRFIGKFVLVLLSLRYDITISTLSGEISPFSTCIGIFGYLVFAW
jgi:hypothetical protein